MGFKPPGAGRKRNTPNKHSSARTERALQTGALPSEGMLTLGRFCEAICKAYAPKRNDDGSLQWAQEARAEFKDFVRLALDAFGKAAPYFETRLASMTVTHRNMDLSKLSDDELITIEAVVERTSLPGSAADREGSASH